MARKTNEQRLLDAENKLKELKAKVKQDKIKFRRSLADDLLKYSEKVSGVIFTTENTEAFEKIKKRIANTDASNDELKNEIVALKTKIEDLQIGDKLISVISNIIGRPVTTDDIPVIEDFLKDQEARGKFFSRAINRQ